MHHGRLVAGDEHRCVAVSLEQSAQLAFGDACKHGRVGDLVTVEMQDRHHRTIAPWVHELVRVPAGRQRPALRLPVTDDAEHGEVRVVERGPVGMDERVSELTAFVDGSGRLGGDMTRDATRK
jgi:hypothetical protein